jgi:hypothetical protein
MYGTKEGLKTFALFVLKMLGTGLSVCIIVAVGLCLLGLVIMKLQEWKRKD